MDLNVQVAGAPSSPGRAVPKGRSGASGVCICGDKGNPVSPFSGWTDPRAEEEAAELQKLLGFHHQTGWPKVRPGTHALESSLVEKATRHARASSNCFPAFLFGHATRCGAREPRRHVRITVFQMQQAWREQPEEKFMPALVQVGWRGETLSVTGYWDAMNNAALIPRTRFGIQRLSGSTQHPPPWIFGRRKRAGSWQGRGA